MRFYFNDLFSALPHIQHNSLSRHNLYFVQHCLKDSNLREKYNLNAVGIRRGEDLEVPPNPFTILSAEDKLLIIGNNSDLDALTV